MEICLKGKILLLALSFCIVFPFFFIETLAVTELDHDCIYKEDSCNEKKDKDNCSPCQRIEAAENFVKNLKLTAIFSSTPMPLLSLVQIPKEYCGLNFYFLSPVDLKVRFNT